MKTTSPIAEQVIRRIAGVARRGELILGRLDFDLQRTANKIANERTTRAFADRNPSPYCYRARPCANPYPHRREECYDATFRARGSI